MVEIRVPTLGESVTEATVATWFKQVGDAVAVDEMLCELETDKVTVEVPASSAGVLSEIVAKEGDTVGVDALLAMIDTNVEAAPRPAKKPARAAAAAAAPAGATTAAPAGKEANEGAESAPANARAVEVHVPTLGESVSEATVATWFKAVGDAVSQDEMLCELETDKVSVEVPAPASGVLAEIVAAAGTTVGAGALLARISGEGSGKAAAPKAASAPAPEPQPGPAPAGRDVEDAPPARSGSR
jgi:2-oxoglutarate dehydrogenase E2 component (dihydrolipoamide succinyltransferase)